MSATLMPLSLCPCCGRSFHPDVIDRHSKICQKNQIKSLKRKTFDSSKMRAKDTDIGKIQDELKFVPSHMKEKTKLPMKKSNWKAKHDDFIKTIRSARGDPITSPKETKAYVNPDYVQCEFCSRRFSESAAERHIPFCKEQQNRIKHKDNKATASDRMAKRNQYKAPLPKSVERHLIPTPKQMRTRTLQEEIEPSPRYQTSIPTSSNEKRFIRSEKSRGNTDQDLSTTRDILKEKRPISIKRNVIDEQSQHRVSTERRERESDRKNEQRRYNMGYDREVNQMTSEIITKSEFPHSVHQNIGFQSQLPTLRKNSHSASSLASNGSNGSSHRHVPLNEYSTPMGKFCYECGCSYPVPQAKFCCECGTKRI